MALNTHEIASLRERLLKVDAPPVARLNRGDFAGAFAVFLLVFLSTFPVVIPFLIVGDARTALRLSNLVAAALLFATGWTLGSFSGRSGLRTGLETVVIAVALVAITIALGG